MIQLLVACSGEPAPEPRPSVLLVVLDTVRADRLALYGGEHANSRQLAAVAEAGAMFTDVTTSSPWSWPSHASLFTGLYPWEHGARRTRGDEGFELYNTRVAAMREDVPTLAEDFGQAGYATASVSVNPWLSAELGLVRGYGVAEVVESDEVAVQRASALMEGEVFLTVNLMTAHAPYNATPVPWIDEDALDPATAPEWLKPLLIETEPPGIDIYRKVAVPGGQLSANLAALAGETPVKDLELLGDVYDSDVAWVDWHLNKLLSAWTAVHPDGIVVVTSDHGEFLGEHGQLDHGFSLYGEVTRVPLVIVAPGQIEAGSVVDVPVQLEAIRPTLLDLSGLSPGAPGSLSSPTDGPIRSAVWMDGHLDAVVQPRFHRDSKLYRQGSLAWLDGALYDVEADPGMLRDLASARPEDTARLAADAADAFPMTASGAVGAGPSRATIEALQALGYVDHP